MERNDFFNAIKANGVSGAYLLHGEEEFVKESALSRLISTVDEAVRALNFDTLYSPAANAIIAACETAPFLSDRRIVCVRSLPKDADADALKAYVPRIPPETVLVFFHRGDADGRLSFVKFMSSQDREVKFAPLNEAEAARWVKQRADSLGVQISAADAAFFVSFTGTDCAELNNEMQKAAAYVGDGGSITKQIISKVVTRNLDYIVFAVLDQVLTGNVRDGFAALRGVISDGEQPMDIASRIGEKARLILQARRLYDRKLAKDAVIKQLGVSPGYGYRVYESARLLNAARVPALEKCAKALCDVATLQLTGRMKAVDALEEALLVLAV